MFVSVTAATPSCGRPKRLRRCSEQSLSLSLSLLSVYAKVEYIVSTRA